MSLLFIDMQVAEQAVADRAQKCLDGFGTQVGQFDRPAGPFVVASGEAQSVHHALEYFARPTSERARAERQLQLRFEHSRGKRPVDLIESDEKVGDLGDDIRLSHRPAPAYDQLVVQKRIAKGMLEGREVTLR